MNFDPTAVQKYIEEMFTSIGLDARVLSKKIEVTSPTPDTGEIEFDITLAVPTEPTNVRFSGLMHIEVKHE